MDLFFNTLKKGIIAIVFVIFGTVAVYVPHPANNIAPAEAIISTLPLQITQDIELILINIWDTLSSVYNGITSVATEWLTIKENAMDPAAWMIAKQLISTMVQSLVSWIENGFPGGGPMFLQDLTVFMDNLAGEMLSDFFGPDIKRLICSEFLLDIQISLSFNFYRDVRDEPDACSLTDIIANMSGFMDSVQGSFSEGGWNDWFDVVNKPSANTPFGAKLSAQAALDSRTAKSQDEERSFVNFGAGFLSGKKCEGEGDDRECTVVKPGRTISDSLSSNLDSDRQSLVTADEMDEIMGALVGQLVKEVFSGAGLASGGRGAHSTPVDDYKLDFKNGNVRTSYDSDASDAPGVYDERLKKIEDEKKKKAGEDEDRLPDNTTQALEDAKRIAVEALGVQRKYHAVATIYLDRLPAVLPEFGINFESAPASDFETFGGELTADVVTIEYGTYMQISTTDPITGVTTIIDEKQRDIYRADCLNNPIPMTFYDDKENRYYCMERETTIEVTTEISEDRRFMLPGEKTTEVTTIEDGLITIIDSTGKADGYAAGLCPFYGGSSKLTNIGPNTYICVHTIPDVDPNKRLLLDRVASARREIDTIQKRIKVIVEAIEYGIDLWEAAPINQKETMIQNYHQLSVYTESAIASSITTWKATIAAVDKYGEAIEDLENAELREFLYLNPPDDGDDGDGDGDGDGDDGDDDQSCPPGEVWFGQFGTCVPEPDGTTPVEPGTGSCTAPQGCVCVPFQGGELCTPLSND